MCAWCSRCEEIMDLLKMEAATMHMEGNPHLLSGHDVAAVPHLQVSG